jgi:hypothetical protein
MVWAVGSSSVGRINISESHSNRQRIRHQGTDKFNASINSREPTIRDSARLLGMSTYLQVLVSSARHRVPRDFRDHHRHDGASMIKVLARYALLSFALLPAASIAEPVTLNWRSSAPTAR